MARPVSVCSRALAHERPVSIEIVSEIKVPLLVLHGSEDQDIPIR
jgi:dipeptidyl aminopeptidase/acylaminoacyl peptidase